MGGICSTYGREEWCIQGSGVETLKKETTLNTYRLECNLKMDLQVV